MPKKKHHIRLSGEERGQLETILGKGKASAHRQPHARILLHGRHVRARAGRPRPMVCLDECTKPLTREVRVPQPASPGRPAREDYECEDYEHERNGVAAIFCAVAPHLGWRQLEERERKTRGDCAAFPHAWQRDRNQSAKNISWKFTAADARTKLTKLCPSMHESQGTRRAGLRRGKFRAPCG